MGPRGASYPKHFYPRRPMTSSVIVEKTRFGNSLILTSTVPSHVNQITDILKKRYVYGNIFMLI